MSVMNPDIKAPMKEPPGIEAVMPPWTEAWGPEHAVLPWLK
jgi:hypothetical protein